MTPTCQKIQPPNPLKKMCPYPYVATLRCGLIFEVGLNGHQNDNGCIIVHVHRRKRQHSLYVDLA